MWSKHAVHRPVPYKNLLSRKPYRAVVVHTNGGGDHDIPDDTSLYNWWVSKAKAGSKVGAHFQVMTSGKAEQYVDTAKTIFHAWDASHFAVGIEVEDDGMPGLPINPAQMNTIVAICKELKVPAQLLTIGPAHGVGWHQKYHNWNENDHNCPGPIRVAQVKNILIPRLKEVDMTKAETEALFKKMLAADKKADRVREFSAGVFTEAGLTDAAHARAKGKEWAKKAVAPGGAHKHDEDYAGKTHGHKGPIVGTVTVT